MLELIAYTPEDGWAYVRAGDRVRLLRPPYTHGTVLFVGPDAVQSAVATHGFISLTRRFSDWHEVVSFLNEEVDHWRREHAPLPDAGFGAQALALAPHDVLVRFLDRVEQELLPHSDWAHAKAVLLAMLKVPAVCGDEALRSRAVHLLTAAVDGADRAALARNQFVGGSASVEEFARAYQAYGHDPITQCTDEIRANHSVFDFSR